MEQLSNKKTMDKRELLQQKEGLSTKNNTQLSTAHTELNNTQTISTDSRTTDTDNNQSIQLFPFSFSCIFQFHLKVFVIADIY